VSKAAGFAFKTGVPFMVKSHPSLLTMKRMKNGKTQSKAISRPLVVTRSSRRVAEEINKRIRGKKQSSRLSIQHLLYHERASCATSQLVKGRSNRERPTLN